jgi:hypothetical protein
MWILASETNCLIAGDTERQQRVGIYYGHLYPDSKTRVDMKSNLSPSLHTPEDSSDHLQLWICWSLRWECWSQHQDHWGSGRPGPVARAQKGAGMFALYLTHPLQVVSKLKWEELASCYCLLSPPGPSFILFSDSVQQIPLRDLEFSKLHR